VLSSSFNSLVSGSAPSYMSARSAGPDARVACRIDRMCSALLTKLIEEAASPEAKALVGIVEAA
jgi:hypothetical protein